MTDTSTDLAPVVLFVYNRPWHTKKTIEALLQNTLARQTNLYIYSDGPRHEKDVESVRLVREELKKIQGMKNVFISEYEKNMGLANSVINGVTKVLDTYSKVIVLEDDIITSPDFLEYMNTALSLFEKNTNIFSVSAYTQDIVVPENYDYDVYLYPRTGSWGWGVWKNRWDLVDWEVKDFSSFISNTHSIKEFNKGGEDCTVMLLKQMLGKIDSWSIRFSYACYKYGGMNIYPLSTKIDNIGFDGSGTHTHSVPKVNFTLRTNTIVFKNASQLRPDQRIVEQVQKGHQSSIIRQCINTFKIIKYRMIHK